MRRRGCRWRGHRPVVGLGRRARGIRRGDGKRVGTEAEACRSPRGGAVVGVAPSRLQLTAAVGSLTVNVTGRLSRLSSRVGPPVIVMRGATAGGATGATGGVLLPAGEAGARRAGDEGATTVAGCVATVQMGPVASSGDAR